MRAYVDVAAPPKFGPFPSTAEIGRRLTVHHGLLRSALTGQANAILHSPRLRAGEQRTFVVSRRGEGERRVCQALRVAGVGLVANFHVTSTHAEEQLLRAAAFADGLALPDEAVIFCGDANLLPGSAGTYEELASWGFSAPGERIDQILVRGLPVTAAVVWAEERRRVDGLLLSDHAPVEATVG